MRTRKAPIQEMGIGKTKTAARSKPMFMGIRSETNKAKQNKTYKKEKEDPALCMMV